MVEIKIPFVKTKLEEFPHVPSPDNPLEFFRSLHLQVSTCFPVSSLGFDSAQLRKLGADPDSNLNEIHFYFKEETPPTFFNDLLDNKKTNFELVFDTKEVNLTFIIGFNSSYETDSNGPIINLRCPRSSKKQILETFIEPKKTGIIKVLSQNSNMPNSGPTNQQRIQQLEDKSKDDFFYKSISGGILIIFFLIIILVLWTRNRRRAN
ncbi:protein of unknown function [endosymbiont DhMRE of Dentiscutata heterogama]|nr:protein of unknown function [endosymbiont DhMRE of Dentiscutata heterogama]